MNKKGRVQDIILITFFVIVTVAFFGSILLAFYVFFKVAVLLGVSLGGQEWFKNLF